MLQKLPEKTYARASFSFGLVSVIPKDSFADFDHK